MGVIATEIRAIEQRSARMLVLAADSTAKMHTSLEAALKSGQIRKDLIEDVRDQLALLAEVSLVAIMAGNLSNRLEGDLAPQA